MYRKMLVGGCLFLISFSFAGCGFNFNDSNTTYSLDNTSPDQFDVQVEVDYAQFDAMVPSQIQVNMIFQYTQRSGLLTFTRDERILCNQQTALRQSNSFSFSYSLQDILGKTLSCQYISGKDSANFVVPIPSIIPKIITPATDNVSIKRSTSTTMAYQIPGVELPNILLMSGYGKTFVPKSNIGMTSATFDTSGLVAGPGQIMFSPGGKIPGFSGKGFKSLTGYLSANMIINVNWT